MARLTPGSRIGPFPYRIVKALDSHGGMSYVYLATDGPIDSPSSPKVIIKVSRVTKDARSFYEDTIYNESERLRNLHHRGIVRILPVKMESDMRSITYAARSRLPDAPWFLVLEYLRGGSVAELIEKNKRLEPALAVEIARMVADTLAFLHSQDQVHLDIKPENLLFRTPYEPGAPVEPVLIDFGVARTAGQEGLEARTLPYAPPERVAVYKQNQPPETVAKPHPSMDIYSLGIVLYQMLTGKRPFEGRSNKKLSSAIMEGNPTRPSDSVGGLPRALDDVVLWAMHRDPAQRPTAAELARKLEAVAREAHLAPARTQHSARHKGRTRARVLAVAALLVAALALGGVYWWGGNGIRYTLPNLTGRFFPTPTHTPHIIIDTPREPMDMAVALALPPTFTPTPSPTPTATRPPKSTVAAVMPTVTPTWTPLPTATPVPPTPAPPMPKPPTVASSTAAPPTATVKALRITTIAPLSPTPTRTATPKRAPATSTPVKLTATPTPRPTVAPTATPRPGNTPGVTEAKPAQAQPTPTSAPARPTASPPPGNSGGPNRIAAPQVVGNVSVDTRVNFRWVADTPLGANQGFELVFYRPWQEPGDGYALDGASGLSERTLNLSSLESGDYRWGVFLAQMDPYQRLRFLGGDSFTISRDGGEADTAAPGAGGARP